MIVEKKRHIAKTVSYRLVSTTIGFFTVWAFTGSLKMGSAFTALELVWKPIQYYVHERVWYRWIKYGLKIDNTNK
jgi:uncharacterized membrane protein